MKNADSGSVLAALKSVAKNELYVSSSISSQILVKYVGGAEKINLEPTSVLTDRELEVFALVGGGMNSREISRVLNISIKTVDNHKTSIREKLSLKNHIELSQKAALWQDRYMAMKHFKHIIFDLDGTLTDPAVGITRSIQYALAKYGKTEKTAALYKCIGPPLRDSFCNYFGFTKEKAEEAVSFYREYFSEHGIFENEVYSGIPELLADLKNDNRKIYLATTKPVVYAEKILRYFNLYDFFTAVSGSNLDGTNGAKSQLISGIIRNYRISEPVSAIMIGDRKYDIEGAKANSVSSIGVEYGYGEPGELIEAEPDFIAETVQDLRKILL
jgi:phosphoglycolate phosphatase